MPAEPFYLSYFVLFMIDEQVKNKCGGRSCDVAHIRYYHLHRSRTPVAPTPEFALLTEVHLGTSQPSTYLPIGYLLSQDYSARLPGGLALGWMSEGSSEDQDQGADKDSGYLGISTDLIPCNNSSRYPPLLVTHGT